MDSLLINSNVVVSVVLVLWSIIEGVRYHSWRKFALLFCCALFGMVGLLVWIAWDLYVQKIPLTSKLAAVVLIVVLNMIGFFIYYIFLRPRDVVVDKENMNA